MKIERGMLENISTVVKIEQERRDRSLFLKVMNTDITYIFLM